MKFALRQHVTLQLKERIEICKMLGLHPPKRPGQNNLTSWDYLNAIVQFVFVEESEKARAELLDSLTKNPQLAEDNVTLDAIKLLDEEN